MKRLIVASLSILALSLVTATAVTAEPKVGCPMMKVATNSINAGTAITPFNLVSRAYQGEYRLQGISSFGSFRADARSGKVTAKTLVQAAIDAKELAPELINDPAYLSAVGSQLLIGRQ
jgi:hypothetical protein